MAKDVRKYRITTAIGKRNNTKAEELLYESLDSKTVLPCYNSTNPRASLTDTKDFYSYKLYLSDTGLFVTLMFIDRSVAENDIYAKFRFPINCLQIWDIFMKIWFAQMIAASGRELYYHTWEKERKSHYYEVDFLISEGSKINVFESSHPDLENMNPQKNFCKIFSEYESGIFNITEGCREKKKIYC